MQRCCPWLTRWLVLTGHEQVLEVRDKTHLSLYVCVFVSLVCMLLWVSDVLSGGCALPRPWLGRAGMWETTCAFEAVGTAIFFGTLCDCLQMLGNYDNEHRDLLERKKQLMASLYTEVMEALEKAKENTRKLSDMLVRMQEEKVTNHVKGYFQNVLPRLYENIVEGESCPTQSEKNREMLCRLSELLGQSLNEPEHIAAAHCKQLTQIPWVEDLETAASGGQSVSRVKVVLAKIERLSDPKPGAMPLFWRYWMLKQTALGLEMDCSFDGAQAEEMRKSPGKFFLEPVVQMGSLIDELYETQHLQAQAVQNFGQDLVVKQWIGCGRPDGSRTETSRCGCKCCMPRLIARMFQCFTCFCCCIAACCRCRGALEYPKRIQIGCFWVEIVSRLHERLINSIVLSSLYCLLYVMQDVSVFTSGCSTTPLSGAFWNCAWQIFRQNALLLGMVWNLPAMITCLTRVQHLDAVFSILEDIKRLENIRSVVKELERNVKADLEKKDLQDAVKARVLSFLPLVENFRHYIIKPDTSSSLSLGAAEGLIQHLEFAQVLLGSSSEWSELSGSEKQAKCAKLQRAADRLQRNHFQPLSMEETESLLGCSFPDDRPLRFLSSCSSPSLCSSPSRAVSTATLPLPQPPGTPPMRAAKRGRHSPRPGGDAREPFLNGNAH